MTCKVCRSTIAKDSRYCNYCGKKIKENHKPKSKILSFLILVLTFIIILAIIALFVFFIKNTKYTEVLSVFFNTSEKTENMITSDLILKKDDVKTVTPPIIEEKYNNIGYFSKNILSNNNYYFTDSNNENIYSLDIKNEKTQLILNKKINSFFIKDNVLFYYTFDGLYKRNLNDNVEIKLLEYTNLDTCFITDEFIYYIANNVNNLKTIYRIDLAGNNTILIKNNVIDYYFDYDLLTIYYSTIIEKNHYDSRNEFASFVTLPSELEDGNYLTLLSCDLMGKNDLKLAEKIIPNDNTINEFINIEKTNYNIGFIIKEENKNSLCVLTKNISDYEITENVNNLFTNEINFFYSKQNIENKNIMEIHEYNPTLMTNTKITNAIDYKSFFVGKNKIYMLVDNETIITFDFDGNNKVGLLDFSLLDSNILGNIVDVSETNIYLDNGIISLLDNKVFYLNKENGSLTTFNNKYTPPNNSNNKWTEIFFNFLATDEFLGSEKVFALADIDKDGVCELLIGKESNNESTTNNFEDINNYEIYKITDNNVERSTFDFTNDNSLSFYNLINDNGFITINNNIDKTIITNHNLSNNQILSEPYLMSEFILEMNYSKYSDGEYTPITFDEYNNDFAQLENNITYIKKFKTNIHSIIKGLYFVDYNNPERYVN